MIGLDEHPLTESEVRRARHGYYAAISYLDERVGEVLDALEATGLAGNTLVVFTADHGELLGERGLWYKMSFLEESARVPLIVRGPGLAARPRRRGRSRSSTSPPRSPSWPARTPATPRSRARSLAGALTGSAPGPARRSASTWPRASRRRR